MDQIRLTNNRNSPQQNKVVYTSDEELAMILSIYGDLISDIEKDGKILTPEQILHFKENFEWDYLNPEKYYSLVDLIKLPTNIQRKLTLEKTYLNKDFAHKESQKNIILSNYEKYGKSVAFRGYPNWSELDSDHISDHVDGIKLFEAVRQGMLAAFHINNLQYDSAVALSSIKIDYYKYVETFTPFVVHVVPINRADGGAMFVLFGIYQEGRLVSKGYSGAYTFRSKAAFKKKREELIEGAYNIANDEKWPIIK